MKVNVPFSVGHTSLVSENNYLSFFFFFFFFFFGVYLCHLLIITSFSFLDYFLCCMFSLKQINLTWIIQFLCPGLYMLERDTKCVIRQLFISLRWLVCCRFIRHSNLAQKNTDRCYNYKFIFDFRCPCSLV